MCLLAVPTRDPRHEDLVTQTGLANVATVSRPERHRRRARWTIRSWELEVSASSHVGVDGQGAGPYDGHGRYTALDPSRVQGQIGRGRGPSRSGTAHPRKIVGAAANESVVKEHGRKPRLNAQEVRPSTVRAPEVVKQRKVLPVRIPIGHKSVDGHSAQQGIERFGCRRGLQDVCDLLQRRPPSLLVFVVWKDPGRLAEVLLVDPSDRLCLVGRQRSKRSTTSNFLPPIMVVST